MYAALDLPIIAPEMRRDTGEIAAAEAGDLPDLVEDGAVRGDLHAHSDGSGDCDTSIAEIVAAAAEAGHDYHAVTDHADGPGTAPGTGLSEDGIRDQMEAVTAVNRDAAIEVLHGVEANVDADGAIRVSDDLLAELDLVVASPHVALGQDSEAATERLVRAVEHPHVDVLGHPSGRLLNERAGLTFDVDRVAAVAAGNGTALEINSNPHRLDLWGDAVQAAVEAGALVAINTDAHAPGNLAYTRYGIHTARRGWAGPDDVLNARALDGLRAFLG
jgi:DNA polymerase (family 10)